MKKYIFTIFSLLLLLSNTQAQVKNLQEYFQAVDKFLSANVKAGKVNYKSINTNKKDLDALVAYVATKQKFNTPSDEKAFYLNAYNILVIKGIINNYPTKGPMEIAGFFDKKQ